MAAGEADLAVSAAQAAEAYEHHLVPPIFGPWAALAVDLAAPKPGEAVLDAACGTGIGVRLAAPRVLAAGRGPRQSRKNKAVITVRHAAEQHVCLLIEHCFEAGKVHLAVQPSRSAGMS